MTAVSADWIRALPKVDLHCHLIGTVRATTFAELARREKIELPDEPERIFADINSLPPDPALYRNTVIPVPQGRSADEPEVSYSLFQASRWVTEVLKDADDLTRIVYEAFEAAHHKSNTHHLGSSSTTCRNTWHPSDISAALKHMPKASASPSATSG